MAEATGPIAELIDEMALKIMMVEPGDLSVMGDLVVLIEKLPETEGIENFLQLRKLGRDLEEVFGMIVMMEIPDTAENYEKLGKCIVQLQELVRKNDQDDKAVKDFYANLKTMGYEPDDQDVDETAVDPTPEASSEADNEQERQASEPEIAPPPAVESSIESESVAPDKMETIPEPSSPPKESTPDEIPDFSQDLDLLSGFIDETFEHIESIEVNVLELEENPDDVEIINKIFRPFHTIKGVSGFLNLKTIQKLAHATENLLDDVRNGKRPMDASVIDVVLKVGDYLRTMVENLKLVLDEGQEHYKQYDIADYVSWVKRVQAGESSSAAAATPKAVQTEDAKETAAMQQPAEAMQAPEPEVTIPQPAAAPAPQVSEAANTPSARSVSGEKAAKKKVGASIKVDVEKLDGLVNAVGELVIMQAMVRANPLVQKISDPKLTKDFSQLGRITSELQKTAMSMRMVPIRQTFQKMIRLVRDLSKKTGKKVDLIMEGEETEIDRNMVDSIYDPLVHMMRNSVDHGVQTPAERERLGKPATGTVHLRAYQKGGNMVIEIEDDGQGLNSQKIRQKALERQLISEVDNLSDHELNNLIFLPGFSTADKITDVSGRGVGMDVVKKAVEKLRGKVEVFSEVGKGSQFVIRLPLTLAIIDGIIVRVGTERYILPTTAIQESLRPKAEHYNTVQGRGEALMVRDSLIPIIRLYEVFGVEPTHREICESIVVVVESEGRQRAIMVDELLGKQEVVIKNLGGIQEVKGVAGGTILGDGRVGLILDLAGLVSSTRHETAETVH